MTITPDEPSTPEICDRPSDYTSVDVRLIEIERTNVGNVRAYAAVEIEVAGIVFIVQGFTITQQRREISVDLPSFVRDGRRLPVPYMPDELIEPVGKLVMAAYRGIAAAV